MNPATDILDGLRERFADDVVEASTSPSGELRATVQQARPLDILRYLREEAGFDRFVDLTAIDRTGLAPGTEPPEPEPAKAPEAEKPTAEKPTAETPSGDKAAGEKEKPKAEKKEPDPRGDFQVVLTLRQGATARVLRLGIAILGRKAPKTPSMTPVYPAAAWPEREVAEMFGIAFKEHPDPRKLLLPDNFEAAPMRREYPLEGNEERTSFAVLPNRDALDAAAREEEAKAKAKAKAAAAKDTAKGTAKASAAGGGGA